MPVPTAVRRLQHVLILRWFAPLPFAAGLSWMDLPPDHCAAEITPRMLVRVYAVTT